MKGKEWSGKARVGFVKMILFSSNHAFIASSGSGPDFLTLIQPEFWLVNFESGWAIQAYFSMFPARNWKNPNWLLMVLTVSGGLSCRTKSNLVWAGDIPNLDKVYPIHSMIATPKRHLAKFSLSPWRLHSVNTCCKVTNISGWDLHMHIKSSTYVKVFRMPWKMMAMSFEKDAEAPWSPCAHLLHMKLCCLNGNVKVVQGWDSGANDK